jgi:hypothetical protein
MLIQGKYDEANDKCLKEQLHPPDGRFPLYKVHVFHTIKIKIHREREYRKVVKYTVEYSYLWLFLKFDLQVASIFWNQKKKSS